MMWDTRTDAICKSRRETSGEASSTVTSLLDLQSPELWDITFLVFKLPLSVVFCYGSPRTLVHESRLGQRRREERIASLREKRWITSSGMGVDQRSMHFMSMPEESYAIPRKWRGLRSDTLHLFSEEHGWRGTGLPRPSSHSALHNLALNPSYNRSNCMIGHPYPPSAFRNRKIGTCCFYPDW
jgi:hypothetical protein